ISVTLLMMTVSEEKHPAKAYASQGAGVTISLSQLSVSRAEGAVSRDELFEKSAQVMWLCNTLHAALSTHHLAKYSPLPQLSERELEVLKWSAAGKTAADVAMILSLSTSTVNFHIRSVISKTNASNKAGAIAIAALRGLL
ncbi:LuxR C-terminal-related transcriptional regulator, partial [Pseudomonas soli]|uniref:LuxR C-terminal-related transcriptional regulator n=1 Tax=Pseudomonas soli TaxID=1306993 RepID=UPI003D04EBDB